MIFFVISLLLFILTTLVYGDSEKRELEIKRDKDKTVYMIGGQSDSKEKDQTEEDRKNSWEMLKNSRIRIDKR